MRLRLFDYLSFIVALLVLGAFWVFAYTDAERGNQVSIQAAGRDYIYSLAVDQSFSVEGPLGPTEIEIADGEIRVVASPCRDKICIGAGWVSQSGQWIACLPNRVFVQVQSAAEADVDVQTY
ncbi:MAG: NusG domain II-containing protein [Spirochaeta sp.]|nr:NusG domain II-containing protein [Spirochaeta sp.]